VEGVVNPDIDFWRGRRVLVTGHTGFKGAWLTIWLARMGSEVYGFALPPESSPNLFSLAVADRYGHSHLGDVGNLDGIWNTVEEVKPEIILHLAAQSLVRRSYKDPVGTYQTNVMGTVNVLEAARNVDSVKAVVVVTSDKCYENREWIWPYRETDRMGGFDPYSNSKGCAELVVSAYRSSFFPASKSQPCRIASVRAGNVIGGGDWSEDRLVPDIVKAFQSREPVEIRHPHAIRPWQHVLEPLVGYISVAERLVADADGGWDEAWNFGPRSADCRPVSDVATRLASAWGEGATWRLSQGEHPHEATFLKVDSSKAEGRLGWRARLGLNDALDWTADWYRRYYGGVRPDLLVVEQIESYLAIER